VVLLKFIRKDFWQRKIFKDPATGEVYVDVEGQLCSMTDEGEPICPVGIPTPRGDD
jgi:hypothetical protein